MNILQHFMAMPANYRASVAEAAIVLGVAQGALPPGWKPQTKEDEDRLLRMSATMHQCIGTSSDPVLHIFRSQMALNFGTPLGASWAAVSELQGVVNVLGRVEDVLKDIRDLMMAEREG